MNSSLIVLTDVSHVLTQDLADFDKEKFQENLDSFIESAINRDDYSFETGLLGAGWLISFFHKHKIMEGDIDEILSDFDDNFYKLAIKTVVDPNSSYKEVLHFIHYFQGRVQNKPIKYNFYRKFVLVETIKLLIDKLCRMLNSNTLSRNEQIEVLLKMSYLSESCINEKEIEEVFYAKTEELIENFKDQVPASSIDQYYLRILQLSCIQYNNPYWVNDIENVFSSINVCHDSEFIIQLNKINMKLFDDSDYKLDLSNYNNPNSKDFLMLLSTNLKCVNILV